MGVDTGLIAAFGSTGNDQLAGADIDGGKQE